MKQKVAVLGAGSWGTAVASSLASNGKEVMLWNYSEDVCDAINTKHMNIPYLDGFMLPESVSASTDMEAVCDGAVMLFIATPSFYLKDMMKTLVSLPLFHTNQNDLPMIGVLTKGFIPDEHGEPQFIMDTVEQFLPAFYKDHLVYVAGPSHAEEVALGKLTGLIAASKNPLSSIRCREILKSRSLLVYSSLDVIGVQVCAAAKNVIAIAFGLLDALTQTHDMFGDNTHSLLLAAGLNEIQMIGLTMGATHPETFTSISGVGDLDVTCRSKYGRNRRFGREIITENILSPFKDLDDLLSKVHTIGYLPEGAGACKYINVLAETHKVRLPLCTGLYKILNKECEPLEFIDHLLRDKK